MHPLISVMLLQSTPVKALHGARKGRYQRGDLEALGPKVLLLGGCLEPLTFNAPSVALPHVPVKDFFQIIFT